MTSSSTQTETPTIHWRETLSLGGNPWRLNPRYHMLLPGGIKILRRFKKQGRPGGMPQPDQWFEVIYDEDYVTEWLLNNVVGCFPNITHVGMRELFTKALKLRKERSEGAKDANG